MLGETTLEGDYWFEPVVTRTSPHHVLISTDTGLLVYDNRLQNQRVLSTPGVAAPLHIRAGEPVGLHQNGFVSLFSGRGGWHRTLLFIHSPQGKVLYKEILDNDYASILPLSSSGNRNLFLVSGRGTVWLYSIEHQSG